MAHDAPPLPDHPFSDQRHAALAYRFSDQLAATPPTVQRDLRQRRHLPPLPQLPAITGSHERPPVTWWTYDVGAGQWRPYEIRKQYKNPVRPQPSPGLPRTPLEPIVMRHPLADVWMGELADEA